jgi:hypothetical protein
MRRARYFRARALRRATQSSIMSHLAPRRAVCGTAARREGVAFGSPTWPGELPSPM